MERRFSSIVVAVDLDQHAGDPTTLAARLGAAAGVPIELVAEVPTTSTATGARAELGRRIAAARLDRSSSYVLSTPAPGSALAEHVAGRAGVLLVTAATTWTSLG